MTFAAFETSSNGGFSPVELYTFTYQGQLFRYTTHSEEITVSGFVYLPIYIERSAISSGTNSSQNSITISVETENEVALFYRQRIPIDSFGITILRMHLKDPDRETVIVFNGVIQNTIWVDEGVAEIRASPVTTFYERLILRGTHQANCNHIIYDEFCTLDRTANEGTASVTEIISSTTIKIDPLPDATRSFAYVGGVLRFGDQLATILRQVDDPDPLTSSSLDILLPLTGLTVGTNNVQVSPGCQNNFQICQDFFSNELNNLGFKDLPVRNPARGRLDGNI